MRKGIVVVDFGGQYAHLITRRIRELGRFSRIVSAEMGVRDVVKEVYGSYGVILSGGPGSVWSGSHDDIAESIVKLDIPVLGICYGHQLLGRVLGGVVSRSPHPEFGPTVVDVISSVDILEGVPSRVRVWMSHNDAVIKAPPGAEILATSGGSPVAAFKLGKVYGVQWHPEVSHSEYGLRVLENWVRITGAPKDWSPGDMVNSLIEAVRESVRDGIAVAAVSGGIDSTVAALIAKKALGDRLKPIFIDHGLHPEGEVGWVFKALSSIGLKPVVVDASSDFLRALRGVSDPEEKRRVIGRVYGEVLYREAKRIGAEYLVQGTIYPDVIESGARSGADVIKTHHNVGGLPEGLGLKLVEPLRWFYKDEVRVLARKLGIPDYIISKKPVPGPGLAVRIEGEVTEWKIEVVRRADAIVREEIESAGIGERLWQYFAVLTGSKATGVRGDSRSYGWVVAVRVVESVDAMTANPARLPWDVLERIASRITSEIPLVSRVVYDITSKPPATIEWE